MPPKKRREGGREGRHGLTSAFPDGQIEAVVRGVHDRAKGGDKTRVHQALITVAV